MSSVAGAARDDVRASIFVGESEMARLMRAFDWETSSLGAPERWPEALKVAVRLLLTSRFEMWLGWGADVAFLYNDAYRPTLGAKHPRSLAMPTRELWAEIWDDIQPRLRAVYERGEATWDRALPLIVHRNGYPEETYHTFSYSPLFGDTGRVEGVFCAVTEETERIVNERRLALLRELASALAAADTNGQVLAAGERQLATDLKDLPFCLVYLFAGTQGEAELAIATGIARDSDHGPRTLPARGGVWELSGIWSGDAGAVVSLAQRPDLPMGAWDRSPVQAALVPVLGQGSERPLGAMVVGLNPYRPFDEDYRGFLRLLADQIASRLASAQVYENERRRSQSLAEAVRLRQEAAQALQLANEQLSSEVALRTQERDRLQRLFQQAPSFMCLLEGPQHVFRLVNEAYLQLVGHRDLIGLTVREALPEVAGQGFFELLDRVYEGKQPYVGRDLAVQLQRRPGAPLEQRHVHLVYQPIIGAQDEVVGIFVDGFDNTHQVQAETALQRLNETLEQRVAQRTRDLDEAMEQLKRETQEREAVQAVLRQAQRMESLGQLTGGVAHDFNNSLQVISTNLHLLSHLVGDHAMAQKCVRSALSGVNRGAKLASQLLAFGRRQPLEPRVVNIGRFVHGLEDMLRRVLGEEIELCCVVAPGLWNTLADLSQIENAILNLVINARDAMDGHGRLTIEAGNVTLDDTYARLHGEVTPGPYVMLAVSDTGSGMSPHVQERAFEPFFSTKPEGKGTGLGLSMVYGFVKQSGGHVQIYSEEGKGTSVKLYLPRMLQEEEEVVDTTQQPVRGGHEAILVVEDDAAVREAAVALLAELGYRVLQARDAASAFSIIDGGAAVDLLFTDVVMPGPMRSTELARLARERLPGLGVLYTSGYTQNAIDHGGRLDPGVELLPKPYTREALARKLRHVLAQQARRG